MIDGVGGVADYQCAHLLGDRYFRLSPLLPTAWKMDDVAGMANMISAADAVDLGPVLAWVTANF